MTFQIQNNRGFTYVELIVVLAIFAVMCSIVLYNYGEFQAKVDIKNLASDIALKVVEAQKSALNGILPLSGYDATWKPSYGLYFNLTANPTSLDTDGISFNKKFIYFSDLGTIGNPQNSFYDSPVSCPGGECLDKITITKNNYIYNIDRCNALSCTSGSNPINSPFSITFKRPDSRAIFYSTGLLSLTGSEYIQITIKSPKSATAQIKVYPSGRVQVN